MHATDLEGEEDDEASESEVEFLKMQPGSKSKTPMSKK